MKKIYSLLCVVLFCNIVLAQKQPAKKTPVEKTPVEKQTQKPTSDVPQSVSSNDGQEMAAMTAYMTPGPIHEMLATFNGAWNEEVTFWKGSGEPPMTHHSNCINKMIMGNRYQESIHTGDMNGMPFEGRSYLGYDNAKNIFVCTWFDNMGTGIMTLEGPWDEKNKIIHLTGKMTDPKTGADIKVREEFKVGDDKSQFMEMYINPYGKEYKSLEIKFTR